ncbi:DUF433 domain-containing protein [Tautonia sp. JC769]|uniref:DUF433 domain-containing protein n=1 Tax=Tautonia sp. JC769 TaxID=3232135 RepID=UPI003458AF7E
MATTTYPHLIETAEGLPIIEGTRIKVLFIARERLAGNDADAIQRLLPDLTLGQIHSALAYYYDHQAEMDEEIVRRDRMFEQRKAEAAESPLKRKLKDRGLIP